MSKLHLTDCFLNAATATFHHIASQRVVGDGVGLSSTTENGDSTVTIRPLCPARISWDAECHGGVDARLDVCIILIHGAPHA